MQTVRVNVHVLTLFGVELDNAFLGLEEQPLDSAHLLPGRTTLNVNDRYRDMIPVHLITDDHLEYLLWSSACKSPHGDHEHAVITVML